MRDPGEAPDATRHGGSALKDFRENWGVLHRGRMGSERWCQLHFRGMMTLESPSWT